MKTIRITPDEYIELIESQELGTFSIEAEIRGFNVFIDGNVCYNGLSRTYVLQIESDTAYDQEGEEYKIEVLGYNDESDLEDLYNLRNVA